MVKKLKAQAKEEDKLFADAVRISAQQIWQAGLGAFAKAQEEGGRVFHKLVAEGTQMQQRGGPASGQGVTAMTASVTRVADGVSEAAAGSWDKLEQVFEERVGRALGAIGVPTREEVAALTLRVAQLERMVEVLGGPVDKPRKTAKKTAAKTTPTTAAPRKPATNKARATP
ncbi:MAG: poly family protein [Massilia sp.]|nr:poly family protein [Massilia sp.]